MKPLYMKYLLYCLVLCAGIRSLLGQEPWHPTYVETPPVIDGILDEAIWQKALTVEGFTTFEPELGKPQSESTTVLMAYDRHSIYIAFRCKDSKPNEIKCSLSNRDNAWADDLVAIYLDPFFDQQYAYGFWINPLGVQNDAIFTASDTDMSFDAVLYSRGRVHDTGYDVEIQIPFKSLRYANGPEVKMGLLFQRGIRRTSENATFPALESGSVSSIFVGMNPVIFKDIQKYRLLETIPAITSHQRKNHTKGRFQQEEAGTDLSLTAKVGLTSQLTLDATVNPDFSQIEADAGQIDVNLRTDLFYPEKRPFFLEGREHFFHAGASEQDGGAPLYSVVHTRNIVDPTVGAKVHGKLGQKQSLALLYAKDAWNGDAETSTGAHFSVLRFKHALKENSYVGVLGASKEWDGGHNRIAGGDCQWMRHAHQFIKAHAFISSDRQAGNDPTIGHALGLDWLHYDKHFIANVAFQDVGVQFKTRTGYLRRPGISRLHVLVMPRFYPTCMSIGRLEPSFSSDWIHDKSNNLVEYNNHLAVTGYLPRRTVITLGGRYASESYFEDLFNTSSVYFRGDSQINKFVNLHVYLRHGNAIYYDIHPFQGRSSRISLSTVLQPLESLNIMGSMIFTDFYHAKTNKKVYDYTIWRGRISYQAHRHVLLRAIAEYNEYNGTILTDLLASFTTIPGTVIHLGYGSFYEKLAWQDEDDGGRYIPSNQFLETQRGLFFKASYLWRL